MNKRKATIKKSEKVKAERGYSPEEVITYGVLLELAVHKTNPKRQLELYWFMGDVWVVPVEGDVLLTAYRSRKERKRLGK